MEKEKDYAISSKTLDKLFDLTGDGKHYKGFIMFHTTSQGNIVISKKVENEIVQMGLFKAIDDFVKEAGEGELEEFLSITIEEEDEEDDED